MFQDSHVPPMNSARNVNKPTKVTTRVYNVVLKVGGPAFPREKRVAPFPSLTRTAAAKLMALTSTEFSQRVWSCAGSTSHAFPCLRSPWTTLTQTTRRGLRIGSMALMLDEKQSPPAGYFPRAAYSRTAGQYVGAWDHPWGSVRVCSQLRRELCFDLDNLFITLSVETVALSFAMMTT